MRTDGGHAHQPWRVALRRIGSGQLLGWISLAGVLLVMGLYGFIEGDFGWYTLVPGPDVAAIAMNVCTWIAAIAFGRTRQLRWSWVLLAAIIMALEAAAILWPSSWGQDLGTIAMLAAVGIGLPTSLVMFVLYDFVPNLPGHLSDVVALLVLLGLGYLQAFLLLPLILRWRDTTQAS